MWAWKGTEAAKRLIKTQSLFHPNKSFNFALWHCWHLPQIHIYWLLCFKVSEQVRNVCQAAGHILNIYIFSFDQLSRQRLASEEVTTRQKPHSLTFYYSFSGSLTMVRLKRKFECSAHERNRIKRQELRGNLNKKRTGSYC